VGASDAVVRRAWLVIAAWIVVALALAPLAAKLNDVIVTEEKGFLPSTAESSRAEAALGSEAGSVQPSAILVVDNARVGLEEYWRLRGPWAGVDWRGANHTSWVDILNTIYDRAYNASLEGVNASAAGLRGYLALWNATLQAAQGLERLQALINGTAQSLQAADSAYAGYYAALRGYSAAWPALLNATLGVAQLCSQLPPAYAPLVVDVARAEYLIENLTGAYQRGYMTQDDVATVVEASNLSSYGIPPLQPALVVAVFNQTLALGGPAAFSNAVAALEAGSILNASLPSPQASLFLGILANATAQALSSPGVPDLRGLAGQGPQGVLQALNLVNSTVSSVAPTAAALYGDALAEATGQEVVGLAARILALNYTCSQSMAAAAARDAIAEALASGQPPVPGPVAEAIASAVASGAASNETAAKSLAARLAVETVASAAAARGAPEQLVSLINSSEAAALLVERDPQAAGVLASNATEARLAAAELVSAKLPGVDPEAARRLAEGADPDRLAVEMVMENPETPPQARPLLELFLERGLPRSRGEAVNLSLEVIVEQAVERGLPREAAEGAAREALLVVEGNETVEEAAEKLARQAVEDAWPRVESELEGAMISRGHDAFIVLLFNASYDDAEAVKESLASAVGDVYPQARVLATGDVVTSHDMREAAQRDVERSDKVSMVLVFVILAIVLESIVAVFLPFIGIGLGLSTALGVAYLLASRDAITVTTISRTVMFSTGLGLGIDYAALISRRFREEMSRLGDKRLAAAAALRSSARPVVAGALTAAIGFGSLALAWDFPFLRSIGTSVPLAIAMVALASLTFTPALLSIVGGSRILWWPVGPRSRGVGRAERRLGRAAVRAAPLLVAAVLALLVPAVWVHSGFRGSHDLTIMMPEGTESLEGIKLINEKFDPGVVYPIYVVPSSPGKADQLADALSSLDCVARVEKVNTTRPYVLVVPSVNPLSAEGVECARQVRGEAHRVDPGSLVGGMAAVSLDLENLLNDRFYHRVLPAAVTLMFLSMLAAYGGVATAIAAVGVVSIAAEYAIALTIAYFQHVEGYPVPWFLPITVFTAILGVGMDYNSFSISRMAEECSRRCSREAVARASVLVLGLSVIMASAYGGLMLGSSPHMRMMGFSLASGVLLAGVLASIALTPPLVALLGRAAWWPWGPKADHSEG